MLPRHLLVVALLGFAVPLASIASCKSQASVPASSDPEGKDLVKGAIVAAVESSGGVRVYKIIHVDDYPDPIGYQLHMIAFDPKAPTFQDAANAWKYEKGTMTVTLDWMTVAQVAFMKRDHRVLAVEDVTEAELAPYKKARDSRK
jgi:hypothetical protein